MTCLIVCAHPDDAELGMGGTIAALTRQGHAVYVGVLADGCTSRPQATFLDVMERWARCREAVHQLGAVLLYPQGMPHWDQQLDTVPRLTLTRQIEAWIAQVKPTEVYTHAPGDANLDHRIVCEAVQPATRPKSGVQCVRYFPVRLMTSFTPGYCVALTAEDQQYKRAALACYGDECAADLAEPDVAEEWFECR